MMAGGAGVFVFGGAATVSPSCLAKVADGDIKGRGVAGMKLNLGKLGTVKFPNTEFEDLVDLEERAVDEREIGGFLASRGVWMNTEGFDFGVGRGGGGCCVEVVGTRAFEVSEVGGVGRDLYLLDEEVVRFLRGGLVLMTSTFERPIGRTVCPAPIIAEAVSDGREGGGTA